MGDINVTGLIIVLCYAPFGVDDGEDGLSYHYPLQYSYGDIRACKG